MFELSDVNFVIENENPFTMSFVPSDKNNNINGTIHGGVLFTLCDDIVGKYVKYCGKAGAAADGSIHYYRPSFAGEKLTAVLEPRKIGRKLGVFNVALKNEKDKLIADAVFTIAFREEE